MGAGDPKTKKAVRKKVVVSPHLGIDSPGVIWFQEWEAFMSGGGGGGGQPDAGGHGPDNPDAVQYVALCDEFHPADEPGVWEGRWTGPFRERYEEALAEAGAHEHASAYVALFARGTFIGPITMS